MNKPVPASEFLPAAQAPQPSPKFQVPLTEAGVFACRFIIGDAVENAICCGAPTDGKSWCVYHRGIVFDSIKTGRFR